MRVRARVRVEGKGKGKGAPRGPTRQGPGLVIKAHTLGSRVMKKKQRRGWHLEDPRNGVLTLLVGGRQPPVALHGHLRAVFEIHFSATDTSAPPVLPIRTTTLLSPTFQATGVSGAVSHR